MGHPNRIVLETSKRCAIRFMAIEGAIRDHRDFVQRHDAPRWNHLRRCLLESGVRAIERGLWFTCLPHAREDIDEALDKARGAFARHASEWK